MQTDNDTTGMVHSYLGLRKAVGWMGILLPFILMSGGYLIFDLKPAMYSLSMYYFTGMRNVLVGGLIAIGFFLFFYRGYDKWDDWIGNIGGFCAICTALFPTTRTGTGPLNIFGTIHLISATIFFSSLAVFALFLFPRQDNKPTKRKILRNRIYIACGSIMVACLVAMGTFFYTHEKNPAGSTFIFWSETLGIVSFGISWLTKGGTIYPDKKFRDKNIGDPDKLLKTG
jgi:hypothetical protein